MTVRENDGQLHDLIETLDLAAIMTYELKGPIRFWSHGCTEMYGWTAEEALGRSSHDLLCTQFPLPLVDIEQVLITQGGWKGDLIQRRRDGKPIVVAAYRAMKRNVGGRPQMVMESLVDVTALREAQAALTLVKQCLEQRLRDEETAREVAKQRSSHAALLQALSQLAGGIAHDFNNVLQAVAGGAALIASRPHDSDAVIRLIQVIGDAAARGAAVTQRMLVLGRRSDLKPAPVDVEALLVGMRDVLIHTLGMAINVQVEVAAGLPRVLADRTQLEMALVNLATNARDAMPERGTLRLIAGLEVIEPFQREHPAGLSPGFYIKITVADDGTGMTAATLSRAGEPFFTTKGVGKGTGLGLSMVKGFAEQSGGGCFIASILGFGTKTTVWLPIASSDTHDAVDHALKDVRSRMTGRILLVDDDKLVRETLMEQLEDLGHKVLAASDGTDALAILNAQEAVDLMITDLSMPGMDGLMLIQKAHGLRPRLPAILLTGYAGDAAALESADVRTETYTLLRKPATSAVLHARVMELLMSRT